MSDKNLREALAWGEFGHANSISQEDIDLIHAAIAKDKEEERLFCKEVVRKKIEGKNVEGSTFNK